MSKRSEWLAGALLAGIGLLFALATLEVGVRLMHLVPDRFWEADPTRGIRLVAGRSGWWSQEDREFVVPVQINSRGLRDVEHNLEKRAGTTRVLLLGDSFVEALHVPLAASVGRQLEEQLNRDGSKQPFEVISAAVSGYGTAASTLFFEQELRAYQPDIVVLAFYPGNDVKNNSPRLEDYLQPQYGEDGTLLKIINRQKVPRPSRSKAFQFVRQTILRRQPELARKLIGWGVLAPNAVRQAAQKDGIPVDYGVYATTLDDDWMDAWRRTDQLLSRLRHDVEGSGARFVVAILPTRDQIYPELWRQIVDATPAMQKVGWDLNAPQRRAEEWCQTEAAACVSLAPRFGEVAAAQGELLHYRQDGHWTPAGHALAASVIEKFLRDIES